MLAPRWIWVVSRWFWTLVIGILLMWSTKVRLEVAGTTVLPSIFMRLVDCCVACEVPVASGEQTDHLREAVVSIRAGERQAVSCTDLADDLGSVWNLNSCKFTDLRIGFGIFANLMPVETCWIFLCVFLWSWWIPLLWGDHDPSSLWALRRRNWRLMCRGPWGLNLTGKRETPMAKQDVLDDYQ